MGRPPQNSVSSIWSSSGSICQLRDTAGWSASGLAISTVLSIEAVWNFTGRRVSGSQEDEGSSGGAQRCTNGKPHIVVLSVTQLPLSCDWGGNTLSNLSAACYCRGLSITPQAAKLSIGIASSEAPENFSGAYRSGGFRQHHNGHHAVLPAKTIYMLGISLSARTSLRLTKSCFAARLLLSSTQGSSGVVAQLLASLAPKLASTLWPASMHSDALMFRVM